MVRTKGKGPKGQKDLYGRKQNFILIDKQMSHFRSFLSLKSFMSLLLLSALAM
jgi:hypothetical protein